VSILKFNKEHPPIHPTQKPVELIKYLINTYTNSGDVVLDSCCGSGTTGVACIQTGRNFICIEKEKKYYDLSIKRINEELNKTIRVQ
jgi:site-specific DNA-methyltransferase (adenine-specific)